MAASGNSPSASAVPRKGSSLWHNRPEPGLSLKATPKPFFPPQSRTPPISVVPYALPEPSNTRLPNELQPLVLANLKMRVCCHPPFPLGLSSYATPQPMLKQSPSNPPYLVGPYKFPAASKITPCGP